MDELLEHIIIGYARYGYFHGHGWYAVLVPDTDKILPQIMLDIRDGDMEADLGEEAINSGEYKFAFGKSPEIALLKLGELL